MICDSYCPAEISPEFLAGISKSSYSPFLDCISLGWNLEREAKSVSEATRSRIVGKICPTVLPQYKKKTKQKVARMNLALLRRVLVNIFRRIVKIIVQRR